VAAISGAIHDVVVVGTGPSACGLVAALIDRGIRPLVVDSSRDEPVPQEAGQSEMDDAIGFKTWRGSDAMYRPHPASGLVYQQELSVRAGNYLGGLSRVWGATYDRYREFRRWPHACIPGPSEWALVASLMPEAVTGEDLGADRVGQVALPMAPRLRSFLDSFPESPHYRVQPSRLAVQTRLDVTGHCTLAGACLTGCPSDAVWWAGEHFARWSKLGRITLKRGLWVQQFHEAEDGVRIACIDDEGTTTSLECRRLFIAAGPIGTAAIMLRSREMPSVTIRDSMTAFTGLVDLRGPAVSDAQSHTLSHIWGRSRDHASFAIQIYPQDPSHAERLRKSVRHAPQWLLTGINRRLYPAIAYLDSDASGNLEVTKSGEAVQVRIGETGDRRRMRGHLTRFAGLAAQRGLMLPSVASDIGSPGAGFHIGASFPHGLGTDDLGRPVSLRRVHLVDGSVLPHLEAGSITPTVMANAARIGNHVEREE